MRPSEQNIAAPPLVSVIIPTYNSALHLADSISSVLNQGYRPFEVIVVDDGSTDDTQAIVSRFGRRIRYVKKANGGPASARNFGIGLARGELVAFQDADDLWLPDKLEHQVKHFLDHPEVGVVFTGSLRFNADGVIDSNIRDGFTVPTGMIFEKILTDHFIAMPSVMVRRRCLDEIGAFEESLIGNEDFNLYLRLARRFAFGFVNRVLVHIRCHANNLSDNLEQMCRDEIKNLDKIARLFPEADIPRRQLAGKIYARFGRYYFSQQRFPEARRCFRKAILHPPSLVQVLPFLVFASLPAAWRENLLAFNRNRKREKALV